MLFSQNYYVLLVHFVVKSFWFFVYFCALFWMHHKAISEEYKMNSSEIEILKLDRLNLLQDFPYFYETHMHTKEASACAVCDAVEMAKAYKNAGYAGLFITNHNWGGNTCVDRSLPWSEWIDRYFAPYYTMREWGDKNNFSVFCGMETGYGGPEFLIFGLEPEFWHRHPEFHDALPQEQADLVHKEGGLVFQAHPMRQAYYIKKIELFPDCVDGVEAFNASHSSPLSKAHNNKSYNDEAVRYAKEHGFVTVAGSDCHSTNLLFGGMAFKNRLESSEDFCNIMRRYISPDSRMKNGVKDYREYDYLATDANDWYTPFCEKACPVSWT